MIAGHWQYSNGSYFEGSFDNNMPKGAGKWHFSTGNVVGGTYRQTNMAEDTGIKLSW
jgi:hypothetical protein